MKQPTLLSLTPAFLAAWIYIAAPSSAQTATPPTPSPDPTVAAPSQTSTSSLVLPSGTVVPLTLVNVIKTKSTPIGGMVRATVAFPVTLGTHLAIPEGVFVEGELIQSTFPKGYKQKKGVPPASPLRVHFTKLIYPNGYTVTLDAQISALLFPSLGNVPEPEQLAAVNLHSTVSAHGPSMDDPWSAPFAAPQQQTPPPTPHVGFSPVEIYAPLLGAAAIATIATLATRHHGEPLDSVAFPAGYPFEMTLTTPLTLDRTRIDKEASVADASLQPYAIP